MRYCATEKKGKKERKEQKGERERERESEESESLSKYMAGVLLLHVGKVNADARRGNMQVAVHGYIPLHPHITLQQTALRHPLEDPEMPALDASVCLVRTLLAADDANRQLCAIRRDVSACGALDREQSGWQCRRRRRRRRVLRKKKSRRR